LLFLCLFYFIPAGLLSIPWVQKKISVIVSEKLHETLGVPVSIGNIDFKLFNKLVVRDVYLEDQQGEVLLQVKRLGVGFDFLPLFRGKIRFNSAQLSCFQFNLTKENDQSPLNLQFVIDAFASRDTTKKKSNIDLAIKSLSLQKGVFTFNVQDAPKFQGKFNAKRLELRDISSKIRIENLTNSELVAKIDRFSFKEQSGLVVRRIAFGLDFSKDSASIKKMEILLPRSSLVLENVFADFKDVSGINDYVNNSLISFQISPSKICLQDLSGFVPAFANDRDLLNIQGKVSGKMNNLKLTDFLLTDQDRLSFQADVSLENLINEEEIFIFGAVKKSFVSAAEIERIANIFSERTTNLPQEVFRLGNVRFEGEISGRFRHLTAFGLFSTDIGNIRTDIVIGKNRTNFIRGTIRSQNIDLRRLLLNDDYGIANFNILVNAQQNRNNKYEGTVNAQVNSIEFKRYTYENINFKGDFTENSFNGTLDVDNPNGKLSSKGFVQLNGDKSVFNFFAKAEHIKLDQLNLSKKYIDSDLSFKLKVDFTGNNIDNLLGRIGVKDVQFKTKDGEYNLDTLSVSSYITEMNDKMLRISSDLLKGTMVGNYSLRDIVPALRETGSLFLPAIIKAPQKKVVSKNNVKLDITIGDLEQFASVFDLPFVLYEDTRIKGNYNHDSIKFNMEVLLPKSLINKMQLKDCYIKLENKNDKEALLLIDVTQLKGDKTNKIASTFNISDNKISSKLKWNNRTDQYNGIINILATLTEQSGAFPLKTKIDLLESKVTLKDSIWNINPSQIVLDSAKIKINQLFLNHADQYVKVNGVISRFPEDSLWVDLNKVNLDYIFDIINLRAFELGGIVSGTATGKDLYHTRQLSTNLSVESFSFNKSVVGDLTLLGMWDDEKQGIQMLGDIYKNDSSSMKVDGMIFPVKKALDFKFNAKNVNASFLRRYLDKVTKDISGLVTGEINLFGNFSNITFSGDAFVKNGSFRIDFLNTTYTFSDYIHLKPDEISINNAIFYDKFGNKALVNGSVKHNYLNDFVFSANMNVNNFLVFNATERANPLFFGTVFGTGRLDITGNESQIDFDIRMRTNENTKITLNFMEQSDVVEYNFINFVSRKAPETITLDKIFSQYASKLIYMRSGSGTDLRFNLQLAATPDATIELIMDPVSGDRIRGVGQGDINIQYGTNSPLRLRGRFVLERGTYSFSLHQLIHREFQIRSGSYVAFNGDPFAATLYVTAIYALSANISDLSESLVQDRMRIPINCVLKITGALERPNIRFDIEAPNSDESIERQIRAFISTEDMMNRQVVYLLALNRFYTSGSSGGTTTQRNNALADLAASTLSSQLSNLLGSISENVQVGAFYTTNNNSPFSDTEMALMLSSQLLNNRLIINGNFGYRDGPARNTSFIGDFDVEWKLTRTGDIRLRAYNHYNDRVFSLRSAYTTQGVGLLFIRDFNNFRYLFRRRTFPISLLSVPTPPVVKNDSITSYIFHDNN